MPSKPCIAQERLSRVQVAWSATLEVAVLIRYPEEPGAGILDAGGTLHIFLDRLEEVAEQVGGRPADLDDPQLSLYHDALVHRFETALALVHQTLGAALADLGHDVHIGSSFTWVVRQSAQAGLIDRADRDALEKWVISRHVTSHQYSSDATNEIVRIVPDFLRCGRRILEAVSGV